MADSGVPFAPDASNVALVEDLNDIAFGDAATVEVLLTDVDDVAGPSEMVFIAKAHPGDSDSDVRTIIRTITQSLTAEGVITPTDDPTVWKATFQLLEWQVVRLAARSTYNYGVRATVGSVTRLVQRGALSVLTDLSTLFDSPIADGSFYADGSLYANGFDVQVP